MNLIFLESTTEGAGKSTQTQLLKQKAKIIKFPEGEVRKLTLSTVSSKDLIIFANLMQMSKELALSLQEDLVICDRSLLSTIVYQDLNPTTVIQAWTAAGIKSPDITIILDLPDDEARVRRAIRGEEPRVAERDNISYRDKILEVSQDPFFKRVIVDASGSQQEVLQRIERVINDRKIYGSAGGSHSSKENLGP